MTKIVFYDSERDMQRGIRRMERRGWVLVNAEAVDQGYGCLKTGLLGCLFLPLALLGKKPVRYKVVYRRA